MRLSVGVNALADYSVIISGPQHDDCPLFGQHGLALHAVVLKDCSFECVASGVPDSYVSGRLADNIAHFVRHYRPFTRSLLPLPIVPLHALDYKYPMLMPFSF